MLVQQFLFWVLTFLATLCALAFVIPPLWVGEKKANIPGYKRSTNSIFSVSLVLSFSFVLIAYAVYVWLGQGSQLRAYYQLDMRAQRGKNVSTRNLYSKIQREVVRSQLNIDLDLSNLDLILSFANAHAQLNAGILSQEVKNLLESVLKLMPQQITCLNILAIDAFKTKEYSLAIKYWQRILVELKPAIEQAPTRKILNEKIALSVQLESKQTKNK